jgi:class 3 adenylate cyclase
LPPARPWGNGTCEGVAHRVRMKRRLSAIVSADVVDFSRMVEADEARALTAVGGVFIVELLCQAAGDAK